MGLYEITEQPLIGKSLNHYEILGPLGAGGMGEVYRAQDTNLRREVAIKLLPAELSSDLERLARLQREAHLLAALNHPNVAAIHSLEQHDETRFLVMELVEGETLAEQLARGPLPAQLALEMARQIARALEAAHAAGIIHRDLKPANIKITPEGKLKVLDFGLAKAHGVEGPPDDPAVDLTHSPTSMAATETGVIMGTAAYMSPEQARGQQLDKRTDIWSFGVVLYEMLSGRNPFSAATLSDTVAGILKEDPDWSLLPDGTPEPARRLVRRCLQKDPDKRLHDIADGRIEIEDADSEADPIVAARGAPSGTAWKTGAIVAAAALAVFAGLWLVQGSARPPAEHTIRFDIELPEGWAPIWRNVPIAFSPDGGTVALGLFRSANFSIWVRRLDEQELRLLPGTDAAQHLFFSPDGRWIGFARDGELRRISVDGGPSVSIRFPDQGEFGASSWGTDDVIVTEHQDGLYTLPAAGDTAPQVLISPATERGEVRYEDPRHIAGRNAILFTAVRDDGTEAVMVSTLDDPAPRVLVAPAYDGHYAASGHLVYLVDTRLFVVPFDRDSLELTSDPVPAPEIESIYSFGTHALANVSDDGTLAYFEGATAINARLAWRDSDGTSAPIVTPTRQGAFRRVSLSPDQQRAAYWVTAPDPRQAATHAGNTIMMVDLATGHTQELAAGGSFPVWSDDGEWIYYTGREADAGDIYRRRADLSGKPEAILAREHEQHVMAIAPDDDWIVYLDTPEANTGQNRLWIKSLTDDSEPRPLSDGSATEIAARISPDGRWIAWNSNKSGEFEIYVTSFPTPSAERQVSQGGGVAPVWAREAAAGLFYRSGEEILVVDFDPATGATSPPARAFQVAHLLDLLTGPWDVSADGQRLLLFEPIGETTSESPLRRLRVIVNWSGELARLVPAPGS